jgi:magnesium chelatase family protein
MDGSTARKKVRLRRAARERLGGPGLSARGYHRVLRVARTIADLEQREVVLARDLDEALGYRLAPAARLAA